MYTPIYVYVFTCIFLPKNVREDVLRIEEWLSLGRIMGVLVLMFWARKTSSGLSHKALYCLLNKSEAGSPNFGSVALIVMRDPGSFHPFGHPQGCFSSLSLLFVIVGQRL